MNCNINKMRKILFRGGNKKTNEWVHGFYLLVQKVHDNEIAKIISPAGEVIEVLEETVGEWTGLKDQFGQFIFEGDVVELSNITKELHGFFRNSFRRFKVSPLKIYDNTKKGVVCYNLAHARFEIYIYSLTRLIHL